MPSKVRMLRGKKAMAAGGILCVHGEKNERKETVISSSEGVRVLRAEVCGACDYFT